MTNKQILLNNIGKEITFKLVNRIITGKVNWVTEESVNISLTKSDITLNIKQIKEIL